ncbi:MAG: integrin alpha [Pseudomonadota bacterium]
MVRAPIASISDDDMPGVPRADEGVGGTRRAVRRALLSAGAGWLVGAGAVLSTAATAGPFLAEFDLATLLQESGGDGTDGMVINGAYASDGLGRDVATADLNGDGIDDIVVSSSKLDLLDTGRTHVIFGRPSGEFPAVFEVQSLYPESGGDGSAGFSIQSQLSDYTGESLAGVGDVNGDGVDDLALGGRFAQDVRLVGESYVVFGQDADLGGFFPPVFFLRDLRPDLEIGGDGSAGFIFSGLVPEDRLGYPLGGAGDINGDGLDDLIVAAPDTTLQTALEGVVFTLFGRDTAADGLFPARFNSVQLLPSAGGTGNEGFVTRGSAIGDRIGWSMGGGFDLNADGRDDVLIGSLNLTPDQSGGAIVLFGRSTEDTFPPRFDAARLLLPFGGDGTRGLFIDGIAPQDETGSALAPAGDVNGDGVDDVIIAADRASPGGRAQAGRAYVVFGRRGIDREPFPHTRTLASAPRIGR